MNLKKISTWPVSLRWGVAGVATVLVAALAISGINPGKPLPTGTAVPTPGASSAAEGFTLVARTIEDAPNAHLVFPVVSGTASPEIDEMVNKRLESDLGLLEMTQFIAGQNNASPDEWELDFAFEAEIIGDVLHLRAIRYIYSGGAHGDTAKTDLYIDTRLGAFYRLDDLFLDPGTARATLQQAIDNAIAQEPDKYLPDAKAAPLPSLFSIVPEGLVIQYPPYTIAPYSEGFIDFLIPVETFMPMVNTKSAFYKALRGSD